MWLFPLLVIFLTGTLCQNTSTFICVDGNVIPTKDLCNGIENCLDGSDEQKHLCYHVICPKNYFRCAYGACIPATGRCDGAHQCADKSDEAHCNTTTTGCTKSEFTCGSGECILKDKVCDGVPDCFESYDESREICIEVFCPEDTFRCRGSGCIHLDSRCNGVRDCGDGSDESEELCGFLNCSGGDCHKIRRSVFCAPILYDRIAVNCKGPKGLIPCDLPVPVGTVAEYKCKNYYEPAKKIHVGNSKAVCQEDGFWNKQILQCTPECGTAKNRTFMMTDIEPEMWVWHAVIYEYDSKQWNLICGGSLVSERLVVTAAHCMWSKHKTNIQVALGKSYSNYTNTENFTQFTNISNIIMHPSYQDANGYYDSDIAILELQTPVVFTENVRPVCLDFTFDEFEHLKENSLGLVFGMGVTENNTVRAKIRGEYLPIVSTNKCLQDQPQDFRQFITFASFCAGWKNRTGVCKGDSGGGLMFPSKNHPGRWVLQGIVSLSPTIVGQPVCANYYTLFTKVALYVKWLRDIIFTTDRY